MKRFLFTPLKLFTYFLVVASVCALFWIERNFGVPSMDQLLFHLRHASRMPFAADRELVKTFFGNVVVAPLLAAVALTWVDAGLSRKIRQWRVAGQSIVPLVWPWRVPALLVATGGFVTSELPVVSYLVDQESGSDFFADHYVAPATAAITANEPKNLVVIYLESMEAAYSDAELFGRNLIRPLTKLPGTSFADFQQVPGTAWTMGGIVGSQCGVPLKNVFLSTKEWDAYGMNYGINEVGGVLDRFLPGADCLSDILQRHGYTNVFVGGASLVFAGKGTFLRNHGYAEVYGREELLAQGLEPALNTSGFYDDSVFAFAKTRFEQLHAAGRPFNLTVLTMDTHGPDGFVSRACAARGASSFADVVGCTASQAAEFIRFIVDNGYLADTRIVVLGDHLAMRNPLSDILDRAPRRTVFNRFIGDEMPAKNRETIVHFDLLPTVLDFIGLRVDGGRLGLGYTALGTSPAAMPTERLALLQAELPKRSKAYLTLWQTASRPESTTALAAP